MGRKDGHRLVENSVPEGWKRVRLGDVADPIMGQSPPGSTVVDWDGDPHEGRGLPFIQGNAEFGTQSPLPVKWCFRPLKRVQSGDVLLSVRAPVGEINRATCSISIGRGLAALRFTDIDPNFGWHMMNHSRRGFDRLTQGSTFEAIGRPVIIGLPILLPPLQEQRAIAAVLDSIDEAIERTEAVIAAMEQLRGSLLHELLTRGVPGWHTEWKDVPGLGTIPADWEVVRLGDVAAVVTSGSRAWSRYFRPDGALFVRSQNISGGTIDRSDAVFVQPPADAEAVRTRIRTGDLLVSITGDPGKVTVADETLGHAYVSQHVALVRLDDPGLSDFAGEFLRGRAGQDQFRGAAYGQTRPGLSLINVNDTKVAFPPPSERNMIAHVGNSLKGAIRGNMVDLNRLRSLRVSVSDALLTGRVRIR